MFRHFALKLIVRVARESMAKGATVRQQFICSGCATKQIIQTENRLFSTAECGGCGTLNDFEEHGCNLFVTAA